MSQSTFVLLGALAGAVAAVFALRFLLVLFNLVRVRLQRPSLRLVDETGVPPWVKAGLDGPLAELSALGFVQAGWLQGVRALRGPAEIWYAAWLAHPGEHAFALLSFATVPAPLTLHSVSFQTFFPDDRSVLTLNGVRHTLLVDPPGATLVDPYAPTLEGQWQAHRGAAAKLGLGAVPLPPDEAVARVAALLAAEVDSPAASERLEPLGDGTFRLHWRAAARLAARLVAGAGRAKRLATARQKALKAAGKPVPTPPAEADALAWAQHDALARSPAPRHLFRWVFAATGLLFAASLLVSASAAVQALVVVGVVLFHELGHFLAMRAFGYQDATIFFIPFLGGAASGRKHDATLGQELIVLFAGPLPGLLVAGAAALAGAARLPWLTPTLWTLAIVNLLNLLPIFPLDGGRIAHALLFARRPWLDVAARLSGALALALLAFALRDAVLGGLALALALAVPMGFRLAGLRRAFHAEAALAPADERAQVFFRVLHRGGGGQLPFAKKLQLAKGVLLQPAQNAAPRLAATLLWLGAYGTTLLAGAAVVVALVLGSSPAAGADALPASREVAALACPLDFLRAGAPPAAAAGPQTYASAVGLFADPEQAAAAARRIAASDPAARVAAFDRALLVGVASQLPQEGLPEGEEDELEGPGARDLQALLKEQRARRERLHGLVKEQGGELVKERAGLIGLSCNASDAQAAGRLGAALADQLSCGLRYGVPPPWRVEATEAELRARRTHRVVLEASAFDAGSRLWLASLLWDLWSGKRDRESMVARLRARVDAAVQAERARGPVDEEVVRLHLDGSFGSAAPGDRAAADRELRARLGAPAATAPRGPTLSGRAGQRGARVTLELWGVPVEASADELSALVGWLCAQGCARPALTVPEPG